MMPLREKLVYLLDRTKLLVTPKGEQGKTPVQSLLLNAGKLFGSNSVAMVLNLIQGIAIARALGPADYGILALISTFTSTVTQLVDSRIWETVIKYVSKFQEEGDATKAASVIKLCFLIDFGTGLLGFVLLYALSGMAATVFLKTPSMSGLIQLNGLSILICIPIGTSSALLRLGDRFGWLAIQNVAVSFARLLLTVCALLLLGGNITAVIWVSLVVNLVSSVSLFVMGQIYAKQNGLAYWFVAPVSALANYYWQIFKFVFSTNTNALLKLLQRNADILIVGFWFSSVEVGYLRYAKSIANMLSTAVAPLYTTSYPEFVRLWHKREITQLRRLFIQLTTFSAVGAIAGLFIVIPGADLLILATGGKEFIGAAPALKWLAFGTSLAMCSNFVHPLLLAAGFAVTTTVASFIATIVQLLGLILLLPWIGISAVGLSYAAFVIVFDVIAIPYLKNILKPAGVPSGVFAEPVTS